MQKVGGFPTGSVFMSLTEMWRNIRIQMIESEENKLKYLFCLPQPCVSISQGERWMRQ